VRVLLLGGTGFIGGYVLRELISMAHTVIVLTRRNINLKGAEMVRVSGKPEEYAELAKRLSPDAVINLIGVLRGDYSVHHTIPKALARVREGTGTRFIHLSALGANENSPVEYFRSKALGEREVRRLGDYAIVRPSLVLGPGQRLFKEALMLRVFPNLKTPVQPVDVRDLAGLLVGLVDEDGRHELNVCGMDKSKKRIILFPLPEFLLRLVGRFDSSFWMALSPNVCPKKDSVIIKRPLRESIIFTAEGLG